MIQRFLHDVPHTAKILEVGCASGAFLKELREKGYSDLWGVDVSEAAIRLCHERGLSNARLEDAAATTFVDESFDVVISSDVLEHIENDKQALHEWQRVLKPQGKLILFVPAHPFLWSAHDVANHHIRRYKKKDLFLRLKAAGFTIKRVSYWDVVLFFPVAFARLVLNLIPSTSQASNHKLHNLPFFVNKAITLLLLTENVGLGAGINAPIGVSLFYIAQKS